jgi:hypothetical protein
VSFRFAWTTKRSLKQSIVSLPALPLARHAVISWYESADHRREKPMSPVLAPASSSRHLTDQHEPRVFTALVRTNWESTWITSCTMNVFAESATRHSVLLILYTISIVHLDSARAREPGQADTSPPGSTLGFSVAENPPPGFYLVNQANYSDVWTTNATTSSEIGPRGRGQPNPSNSYGRRHGRYSAHGS